MDKRTGYERYGLRGNPFRDLASESLDEIDILHVNLNVDEYLGVIKNEVLDKASKAVIVLVGDTGAGKTHRLKFLCNEAEKNELFYVYKNVDEKATWVVKGTLEELIKSSDKTDLGLLTKPKWYKQLNKIKKNLDNYSPENVGRAIADCLNANAPSFLMFNDLHRLASSKSLDRFVRVLRMIFDNIDDGVMILIGSRTEFFQDLVVKYPSINEHINRRFVLDTLEDEQASLLIAKRLLEKRIVEDIEPLYPFTKESTKVLNEKANGNPRLLLNITSIVLDHAAQKRVITIDEEFARESVKSSKNKKLDLFFDQRDTILKERKKLEKTGFKEKIKATPQIQGNPTSPYPSKNDQSQDIEDKIIAQKVKVKCPKCGKVSSFNITGKQKKVFCPNPDCDFSGMIKAKQNQ